MDAVADDEIAQDAEKDYAVEAVIEEAVGIYIVDSAKGCVE